MRRGYLNAYDLCRCDVVLAEVYSGLHPDEVQGAEHLLATLRFPPTSDRAARQAGSRRYTYARQGKQLSVTDCLIAATAREHHATIVTRTTDDYPMPDVTTLALPRPPR